ncbi:hypothetical protein ABZ208_22620 [Streptomyces sp. NPDC006208]|uniref:hypothetical protein n=1 Tax=Streptomyces sp. NPDC006208 TaxID=3156734 RepID=UPI0033B516E0
MRATRIASLSLGCLFAVALTAPVAAADDEAEASAVMPFGFDVSPQRVAPGGTLTLTVTRCAAPTATVSSALFDTVTLTDGKPGTAQVNADAKAGGEYEVSFHCKGEKGATSLIVTGDSDDPGGSLSAPDDSPSSVPRPNSALDSDSGSDSEPGTDTEPGTDAGLDAGSGSDPRLASDSDATSRSETGFASDPTADSDSDSGSDSGSDADAGSHLASDSDLGSHPEPDSDSDKRPDTAADSDKRPDTDANSDKRPDTAADSDFGSHPDAGADKRRPQHPGTGHDSGKRPQHPVVTKPGGGVRGGEGGSFAGVGTGPAALGYALVAGAAAGGVYLMRRRRDRTEGGV